MRKNLYKKLFLTTLFVAFIFTGQSAFANFPENTFSLSPAKLEAVVEAGQTKTLEFLVTNRLGQEATFLTSVENVSGSSDPSVGAVLSDQEDGAYSLKNFVKVFPEKFILKNDQSKIVSIRISLPPNVSAGGRYGALLVGPERKNKDNVSGTLVRTQVGSTIYVNVPGDTNPKGQLKNFSTVNNKKIYLSSKPELQILFENLGNVHLKPYGEIKIKNILGKEIKNIKIDPWFILPDSLRTLTIPWDEHPSLGFYKLELNLKRGYGNALDQAEIWIFLFSWAEVFTLIGLLLVVLIIILKFGRKSKLKWHGGILVLLGAGLVGLSFSGQAFGFSASSSNYVMERDSINVGGLLSTSSNYTVEDTAGEVATGRGTSTSYILEAGYQQIASTTISVSSPADVTLTPNISVSDGGQANGSAIWTVTTDNSAGYTLSLSASTNPAMQSGGNSFADYTVAVVSVPDFTWSVVASDKEFGFSPEGDDIHDRFKDDGVDCNTGAGDTSLACWDAATTTENIVATKASAAQPGVATTVNFRAEAGSSSNPEEGNYTAVITVTALAS